MHNLSIRKSGFVEMAYVGEVPWHGLGNPVTKGAPIEQWQKDAGLDWHAVSAKVQYHNHSGLLLPYDGKQVLYRSDTCEPVGLVSDKYQIVQPAQVLELFRDMTEQSGWYIHTAGVLRGGSKIWVMATNDDLVCSIGKQDVVKANMLCATSLDGSMRTTAKLCAERVVCENTFNIALQEEGEQVTMSHRGIFDPDHIKESLGVAVHSFDEMMEKAAEMAERAIGTDETMEVLRQLFGQPTVQAVKPTAPDYAFQRLMSQFKDEPGKKREQRSVTRCLSLFAGEGFGSSLPGSVGTRWGLFNAITQHIDHERGRTADTRMDSAWFGEGERIKGLALDMLAPQDAIATN